MHVNIMYIVCMVIVDTLKELKTINQRFWRIAAAFKKVYKDAVGIIATLIKTILSCTKCSTSKYYFPVLPWSLKLTWNGSNTTPQAVSCLLYEPGGNFWPRCSISFQNFVTFVIRNENMMLFLCTVCELWVLQLVLFKLPKAENTITCNPVLCIKMTSISLCWSQKWQNFEMCTSIRSIIPNINSL